MNGSDMKMGFRVKESVRVKVQLVGFQVASSSMDGFKALEDRQGYDCKFETATRSCNSRYSMQLQKTDGVYILTSFLIPSKPNK